jgi:E3 ubiquitin-protein ligase MYCBP2
LESGGVDPSAEAAAAPIVREAMSPSVAESIRAVFAAFVWHSGIVQDTMACAAFLKFNSGLTKHGGGGEMQKSSAEREESSSIFAAGQPGTPAEKRTRQRHSVEVTSTTYLNYKENDWVDRVSGGNANRNVIVNGSVVGGWEALIGEQQLLPTAIPEHEECGESKKTVPGLPPTLGQLVLLWEGTVLSCLDTILGQSSGCGGGGTGNAGWSAAASGSGRIAAFKNLKNNREANTGAACGGFFSSAALHQQSNGSAVIDRPRDGAASGGKSSASGVSNNWLCDICGGYFEPPVTYHMRAAHPGCGGHAGGKGYNSGGQYCGGWAGNCGDGGIGGSSWYLICERCKERHRRKYQQPRAGDLPQQRFNPVSLSSMLASFSYAAASSPVGPLDCHVVMKANSMFLLELASSGSDGIEANAGWRRPLGGSSELETVSELASGTGIL